MAETRKCVRCGLNRQKVAFKPNGRICFNCQRAGRKVQVRRLHVQKSYNLTQQQYNHLIDFSDGRCQGCGETRKGNLCVDHDHASGLVRGLLCRRCNRVLGLMRDNKPAIHGLWKYLVAPPAERLGIQVEVNREHAERPRRSRWNRG